MSVENALYTLLNGRAELAALVSDRIYSIFLPQKPTLPACAYRRTSSHVISNLKSDTNLIDGRFEIAAFAKTHDQCIQVADEIRQALQRQRGTVESIVIEDITIDNIDQDYEPDFEVYEITTDVTISYRT